jgi:hypothetical protein
MHFSAYSGYPMDERTLNSHRFEKALTDLAAESSDAGKTWSSTEVNKRADLHLDFGELNDIIADLKSHGRLAAEPYRDNEWNFFIGLRVGPVRSKDQHQ